MKFEVNITAYKYRDHVNNLIDQIRSVIPSVFIRVWDNSPNRLRIDGHDEIRWNRFNPSLSRVWNWAIAQSRTEWVMITNDDINLKDYWWRDLEIDMERRDDSLWHGPSRCFLFHKRLIKYVGWFDERLTGFTYEDLDYIRRMNDARVSHVYGTLSSLHTNAQSLKHEVNRDHDVVDNRLFMELKYDNNHPSKFIGKPNFETPDFYPCRPK